ncbi:MAG: hypothetical protein JW818_04895 [Pirellulales bacterium]|nr:hypothetical protein [Pirellulales bacterium]
MAGPYRKPEADVFTAMLVIALVAIIMASIFLYLETKEYGTNKRSGGGRVSWVECPETVPGTIHVVAVERASTQEFTPGWMTG